MNSCASEDCINFTSGLYCGDCLKIGRVSSQLKQKEGKMSELEELKEQLKEANRVITVVSGHLKGDSGYLITMAKKYLKPKDPLFEKLKMLMNKFALVSSEGIIDEAFEYFQKHFKEELNGNKKAIEVLDEAISITLAIKNGLAGEVNHHTPEDLCQLLLNALTIILERLEGER